MFQRGGRQPKLYVPRTARQRPPKGTKVVCLTLPKLNGAATPSARALARQLMPTWLPKHMSRELRSALVRGTRNLARRIRAFSAPAKAATTGVPDSATGAAQDLDHNETKDGVTSTASGSTGAYADKCPDAAGVVRGKSWMHAVLRVLGGKKGGATIETVIDAPFTAHVADDGTPDHMTVNFKLKDVSHTVDRTGVVTHYGYQRYDIAMTLDFPLPLGNDRPAMSNFSGAVHGDATLEGFKTDLAWMGAMVQQAVKAVDSAKDRADASSYCQNYTAQLDSQVDMTASAGSPFAGSFHLGYTAAAPLTAGPDGGRKGAGPGSYTATSGSMTHPTAGGDVVWSVDGGSGADMLVTAFDPQAKTISLSVGAPPVQQTISTPGGNVGMNSPLFAFAFSTLEGATLDTPLVNLSLGAGPVTSDWGVGVIAQGTFSHSGQLGTPLGAPVPLDATESSTVTVTAARKS